MEEAREADHRDSADDSFASPAGDAVCHSSSTAAANDGVGIGGIGGGALARGLSAMLDSVIRDFDSKAQDTMRSQDELSDSLSRLIQELDQLLENAPLPFIVQNASRISSVRQRVSALNYVLKNVQRRIDNIDQMLSVCISHVEEGAHEEA
ncbi:PREDICTED: uncharacterized protein LOC104808116 isoform X2 [Tarenaya hassleriana]|nr:PREDICTED: uncharacterized protein LOC104808116 isoform X2 [Tarenaya hassleriana]XP_010531970.1 PREDICTED: uncharacterized protein LOC104808116 isoform X2 [Tarenaya hassleriana]XP_010531972.1 PREDICTED: uncharacterized protein LOC104808116 isoform X2 [Tarenaya hassleriana]